MIKTKFYSELTKKLYDTQEEAEKEEKALEAKNRLELKKKEEKTARAKEIEEAYKKCVEANQQYVKLKNAFIKDYGSFHMTYTDKTPKVLEDPFTLWNFLF